MARGAGNRGVRSDHKELCGPEWGCASGRSGLVLLPTYNEAENLLTVVAAILAATPHSVHVLVIDDGSPDGTARLAAGLCGLNDRVHLFLRRGPRGLGAAYMSGFRWGLRHGYQVFVQMDADLSHDPRDLPRLLAALESVDLVIGSRYCPGGRLVGWPRSRRLLSFAANLYARGLLGSRVADMTAGFKCWRRHLVERIDFAQLRCNGYGFQVEMTHLAEQAGCRIVEIPICFTERWEGQSKMSRRIAWQAARKVLGLALQRLRGRPHPALLPGRSSDEPDRPTSTSAPASQRRRRILMMCLGGIGDTVLSFAALRQLRRRWPTAHITALAMWPQSGELLEDLGIFDEVVQHDFQHSSYASSLLQAVRLHRGRLDVSILAFPTNRFEYNLLAWLIHARRRYGHRYLLGNHWTYLRWLLTDSVDQQPGRHVIAENVAMVAATSGVGGRDGQPVDIRLGPIAGRFHHYADRALGGLSGPLLGVHAGGSTYKNLSRKRWPAEKFAELCSRAWHELGLQPLLFGGPAEGQLNRWIAQRSGAALTEPPSVRHTAALIQRCAVFVSNDSGLAHIASALDVPVVMIVGPTDPQSVRPSTSSGRVVRLGLGCSPCFGYSRRALCCQRGSTYACLQRLDAGRVLEAVQGLLTQVSAQQPGSAAGGACNANILPLKDPIASFSMVGQVQS